MKIGFKTNLLKYWSIASIERDKGRYDLWYQKG